MDSSLASSSSAQQKYEVAAQILPEGKVVTSTTSVEFTPAPEVDQLLASTPVRPNVVMLTYLPSQLTEENLEEICRSVGPLLHFRLVCHTVTGERCGYAFATFTHSIDATKACRELDGLHLLGKAIKVCPAREQHSQTRRANLHISGLSSTWTVMDLFSYFRYFGRVISCKVLLDAATNSSRGIGFVRYESHAEAVNALSFLHGTVPAGEEAKLAITFAHGNGPNRVKRMYPASTGSGSSNQYSPSSTADDVLQAPVLPAPVLPFGTFALFVGNLRSTDDENYLKQLFGAHGVVKSVKIMQPGNLAGGGYAFVNMSTGNEAFVAVAELSNLETAPGHHLIVSVKSKTRHPASL